MLYAVSTLFLLRSAKLARPKERLNNNLVLGLCWRRVRCKQASVSNRVLLIPGTGNGERGTGNRERESGNECTAVIRIRIRNGGRNHGKWSGN